MRLVAAVDIHDKADEVIAIASPWAKRFHGTLDLLFASEWSTEGLPPPALRSDELDALWASWEERASEERRALVARLEALPEDIRGYARVLSGRPADVIPDAVRPYDLLVVATHARKGVSRVLLGSVVHRLVRQLQTPALVAGLVDRIPDPSGRLLVLAPVDERGEGALPWISAHLGAERVEIVHVTASLGPRGLLASVTSPQTTSLQPVLDGISLKTQIHRQAEQHGFPAAPVRLQARETQNPGDTIAKIAGEIGADLIVMPTHGRSGLQRWFVGSVAERVMERAPCAVLVVPVAEGAQG